MAVPGRGPAAVVLAAVVGAVLGTQIGAVGATRPAPEPGARVVGVHADCLGGRGVVSMREVRHPAGATSVDVTARGVRNGPWRGTFYRYVEGSPGSPGSVEATALQATAVDHRFALSLETGAVRSFSGVVLRHRRAPGLPCRADVEDRRRVTLIMGERLDGAVRHNEPGVLTVRAAVGECRNGSHWRAAITARFGTDVVVRWGTRRFTCAHHSVVLQAGTRRTDSPEYPTRVAVVARSSGGDRRRFGYHVSDAG